MTSLNISCLFQIDAICDHFTVVTIIITRPTGILAKTVVILNVINVAYIYSRLCSISIHIVHKINQ